MVGSKPQALRRDNRDGEIERNVIYVVGQFLIPNLPLFVMSSLSCIVVVVSG